MMRKYITLAVLVVAFLGYGFWGYWNTPSGEVGPVGADSTISNLTAATGLAYDDLFVIVDTSATTTKKLTVATATASFGFDNRYLALNGGTLTGALYGTSASFSTDFEVGGAASLSALTVNGVSITHGVSSNSIDWDEITDTMTLDASTTVASGGYSIDWGSTYLYGPTDHTQITDLSQYVTKKYVDIAATQVGVRYYMLDDVSGVSDYLLTSTAASADAEVSSASIGVVDEEYLAGWISPVGSTFTRLNAGVYDWHITAEKTAGTQISQLYWTLVEYKTDTSEVTIATSSYSNTFTSKANLVIGLNLNTDYEVSAGSRIVGKVYAYITGLGTAPDITLYWEGDVDSHWEIPGNLEFIAATYVPYTGATAGLNLGSYFASASYGEFSGYASASLYFGTGLEAAGDCNDATDKFLYDSAAGTFSCGTLVTADISDLATYYLPLTGGTLTGVLYGTGASFSAAFETSSYASASKIWVGNLFRLPSNGTLSTAGDVIYKSASTSIQYYNGSNIITRKTCFTYVDNALTSATRKTGKAFNDPFTITSITSYSSGSNSVGWNLGYGVAGTTTTKVFASNKSASSSFTYTTFGNSAVKDGNFLDLYISSASAVNSELSINVCGYY